MARKQNIKSRDLAICIYFVYKVNRNTSNNYFLASFWVDIVVDTIMIMPYHGLHLIFSCRKLKM